MPTPSDIERTIRRVAADMGASDLANMLVAIAKRESSLKTDAVGDGGKSVGIFQEHEAGRGSGLSKQARMDPVASTKRAIAEIRTVQRANPKADAGTIAILAQRPREDLRAEYRADINAQVTRLGNTAEDQTGTRPAPTGGRRPPSATAQAAQARALQIAQSQGRTRPQSPAATQGQARAQAAAFKGTYVMPVDGVVTNPYGGKQTYSEGKTTGIGTFNNGADIGANAGTVVRAPVGGVVKAVYNTKLDDRAGKRNAEENSGWGGQVIIQGDDGKEHRLSHAQFGSIQVKQGQRVEQGQPTHKVGMSGNATGPHVDWEKWTGGKSEDPLKAPLVPAADGAKAYQAAIARMRQEQQARATAAPEAATESPTPAAATGQATGPADTGATNVGQTANDPLVTTYQQLTAQNASRIQNLRRQMDEYQRELAELQAQKAAGATNVQQRINALSGGTEKPGAGLIGQLTDDIRDLEQVQDQYQVRMATAQATAAGKTLTPEEKAREEATTEKIRVETEALRKRAAGTDISPLERTRHRVPDRCQGGRGRGQGPGPEHPGAAGRA